MSSIQESFGPHTEHVVQFFERADHLTPAAWRHIAARYRRARGEGRERAERVLIEHLLDDRSRLVHEFAAQERVRGAVDQFRERQLADRRDAGVPRRRPLNVEAVRVALAYAVAVLVARDLVDDATFAILYEPFRDTIPPDSSMAADR